MVRRLTIATCTLNQWAMDFDGNVRRILESIKQARLQGANYRTGPELEITGYSCEDHFLEPDTFTHSWEALIEILVSSLCQDMLIDVGMPIQYRHVLYNCRIVFYNRKILLIRPKLMLCEDGNYRESRWFSPWRKLRTVEDYHLPTSVRQYTGQVTAPIGDGVVATRDTSFGYEICEELWNPMSTHIPLSLDGVDIIVNGSGSYKELRKAHLTIELIRSASFKSGGCYLYSNLRGCDGQRVYFNGCSCIALNGEIMARGEQFGLSEVEVVCATLDLDSIIDHRTAIRSRSHFAAEAQRYPRLNLDITLCSDLPTSIPTPIQWLSLPPEQEIALGPACWLWDYLRRSGQGGFFLPLSGGVDSSSTAVIVFAMCTLIVEHVQRGDNSVLLDVQRIVSDSNYVPRSPQELCNRILVTCYMASENSSKETENRAHKLASQIGSYHMTVCIDVAVQAILSIFNAATRLIPRFRTRGGTARESLALQNLQARVRMVVAYLLAQLMLWARDRSGGLLVLGSANVDEALRGYFTKYDCSSADVNPIGGVSKQDLRLFLRYATNKYQLPILEEIISAPPTAELEPLAENGRIAQTDEEDMGMTYEELSEYGRLRKQHHCGPYSMFLHLADHWNTKHSPEVIADKVKHFFRCYAINRHKMTVLTPSYHAESYSPDDNRFDHRPFLYNAKWPWQFRAMDEQVSRINAIAQTTASADKRFKPSTSTANDPKESRKPRLPLHPSLGKLGSGEHGIMVASGPLVSTSFAPRG